MSSFACGNNFLLFNAYVNSDFSIINQHDNIKDLGILMSFDCRSRSIFCLLVVLVGVPVYQAGY